MRVVVSIGHGKSKNGGYDPGACRGRYEEFAFAKQIGKYLHSELIKRDVNSILLNYAGDMYITDRIKRINALSPDLAVEIHLNAGGGHGTEAYYSVSGEGRELAQKVSANIAKALGVKNRGAKTRRGANGDYFGIIRQTKCKTLLIETVFIDTDDLEKIKTEAGMKKCALAIADALTADKDEVFLVRVKCDELNVRAGAGVSYPVKQTVKKGEAYTIIEVKNGWGRLRSGAGWISLNYTERV